MILLHYVASDCDHWKCGQRWCWGCYWSPVDRIVEAQGCVRRREYMATVGRLRYVRPRSLYHHRSYTIVVDCKHFVHCDEAHRRCSVHCLRFLRRERRMTSACSSNPRDSWLRPTKMPSYPTLNKTNKKVNKQRLGLMINGLVTGSDVHRARRMVIDQVQQDSRLTHWSSGIHNSRRKIALAG